MAALSSRRSKVLAILFTTCFGFIILQLRQQYLPFFAQVLAAHVAAAETSSHEENPEASTTSKCADHQSASDWFDTERWERLESQLQCFYVENICHGAELFFYDKSNGASKQQPKWEIQRSGHGNKYISHAYPVDVMVDESPSETDCYYSPISNHVVLHGAHISMLGEFYARVLPGLSRMMVHFTSSGTESRPSGRHWQEGTQLYVDAWKSLPNFKFEPMDKLLDSHHLFLSPFTSNPILPFHALQDNTGCSCMKRLFFCGYEEEKSSYTDNGRDSTTGYKPGSDVLVHSHLDNDVDWTKLRHILRGHVISENIKMKRLIKSHRKAMIGNANKARTSRNSDAHKYRIVGLAQRNFRRRWRNIEDALEVCKKKFARHNIICVEVNLERDESNPMWQVTTHGALDMLIGIHGAQLTEAIWMKSGAVVVELLPYISKVDYGSWVSRIDEETPLGIIFRGTDLQHVGYPLGDESLIDRNESKWAYRDFNVEPRIVQEAIQSFLTKEGGVDDDCKHLRKRGANFSLYNVHCDGVVQHFYRSHWLKPNSLCKKDRHWWCPENKKG